MAAWSPAARRLAAVALLLLFAAPACLAQDDGGDEPYVPGQIPGIDPPITSNPTAPKRRKWTSLQLLRWEWDAGVAPPHSDKKVMAPKDAMISMADGDNRPLLLFRECAGCKRDDHALLDREIQGDKTILMGRWYHAIKFSDDVLAPDHPYHALFDGNVPPHLIVGTADGTTITGLSARANQSQLYKTLGSVLRKAYKKDPDAATKALLALLDDFDTVDAHIADLDDKLAAARREKGEDSKDVHALEAERKAADDDRQKLLEKGKTLDDLQLKTAAAPAGG
ncbi:MAG TPA: hypothetical protein VFY71_02800 [Planctomycetota bacterium]|nr:hypothetical protein [Planctomycetota bacterium]